MVSSVREAFVCSDQRYHQQAPHRSLLRAIPRCLSSGRVKDWPPKGRSRTVGRDSKPLPCCREKGSADRPLPGRWPLFPRHPKNESRATADQIRLLCERNGFAFPAGLQKAVDAMFHPDELRQTSFHRLSLRRQGKRLSRCVPTGNIVMLHRTTTPYAPWTIVESNWKRMLRQNPRRSSVRRSASAWSEPSGW